MGARVGVLPFALPPETYRRLPLRLSAGEWEALFHDAGFTSIAHRRISDPTPAPESYTGRWFQDSAQLRAFRQTGALLVHGTKTEL